MKRAFKRRDRQYLLELQSHYENSLAEKEKEKTLLLAVTAVTVTKLAALEEALKDIQAKVSSPKKTPGLLENIDASVIWIVLIFLGTGMYNDLAKKGMPWIYAVFHIGSTFLLWRTIIWFFLIMRRGAAWDEISPVNTFLQLLSGISTLTDVWVGEKFNLSLSLPNIILPSLFGAFSLYWGLTETLRTLSERIMSTKRKIREFWHSTTVFGMEMFPGEDVEKFAVEHPDLTYPFIEERLKKILHECPVVARPIVTFEFWRAKRNIKALIAHAKCNPSVTN